MCCALLWWLTSWSDSILLCAPVQKLLRLSTRCRRKPCSCCTSLASHLSQLLLDIPGHMCKSCCASQQNRGCSLLLPASTGTQLTCL